MEFLRIPSDCGKTTCDRCRFLAGKTFMILVPWCTLFDQNLIDLEGFYDKAENLREAGKYVQRCDSCLKAQVR